MYKILIPDRIDGEPTIEKNILGDGFEVITKNAKISDEIDDAIWKTADAILAWHDLSYDKKLISKLLNCKIIVRVGVGFDNVDLTAATKAGIIVSNVPDYGTNDVADHSMALLLGLTRQIYNYHHKVFNTVSWNWDIGIDLRRLRTLTLGIIGCGRIGTAMIIRAKSFGLNTIFYDPYVARGYEKSLQVKRLTNLYELLSVSDIISFHVPLNNETLYMADDDFFSNLKHGCTIINTSRGQVIKLDSLYNAMKNGIVSKVGLDVIEKEPIDLNHPLFNAVSKSEDWIDGRVLITPHCAFYCNESYIEMREKAAHEVKRVLNGKKPLNKVNK